jgi:predicted PolB exonuclease-like 3'-5' exonuclease
MHQARQNKTYAVDIETVSQGKRANDYTDNKEYKAPSNYKDQAKIEAKVEEQRQAARGKHGLHWFTGKVCSISFVDVFGNDEPVSFYGFDESEILLNAIQYMEGSKLVGMNSKNFDFPFLVGRYMANGLKVPTTLKQRTFQYDVNEFFGWSNASGQRGSLNDYAQGIGYKEKPLTGNKVQGIYDTALDAHMKGDDVALKAAWKQIVDYNVHDCEVVKSLARAYYGSEGLN